MGFEFPLWLGPAAGEEEGPPFGAPQYRQLVDLLFGEGVLDVAGGGLAVTPSSGLMLNVAAGSYVVDGDDVVGQGAFFGRNLPPGDTVTIPAAPASNSRIDRVVVRIHDAESTGGTLNLARLEVVQGVAAASPVAPAVPASAIPLARVTVAAGTSTITSGMIVDERTQAGAASLQVGTEFRKLTTAQRDALVNPAVGTSIFNTTTNRNETYLGGSLGWIPAGRIDVQTFTVGGTWTKPAGAALVLVQAWGGGGGGGGGNYGVGVTAYGAGGGGGGGALAQALIPAATLTATVPVTVGAGGPGGTRLASGTDGGASLFGSLLKAGGGKKGDLSASGGSSGSGGSGGSVGSILAVPAVGTGTLGNSGAGGAGAAATSSTEGRGGEFGGASGGGGQAYSGGTGLHGGSGGGGGMPPNSTAANVNLPGGAGGLPILYGGGNGGAGGSGGFNVTTAQSMQGIDGTLPAGGGGGGGVTYGNPPDFATGNTNNWFKGGNGARGEVRVYTFCL